MRAMGERRDGGGSSGDRVFHACLVLVGLLHAYDTTDGVF